jgi:flagellar hook protein FlgE
MASTFSIALSALQAESDAINITGNNLANLNTDGFKGSTVDFKDLFSQYIGSDSGYQVGLGVGLPISNQMFSQGSIQNDSSNMAVAIQGNGFFNVVSPDGNRLYTRDGNFTVSSTGVLQTQTGENVQGWNATAAGINTNLPPTNIQIPTNTALPPQATQNISMSANLDASAVIGSNDGTLSAPIQVVDSLGNTHDLTVTLTKTAADTWSYAVTIPGADVGAANPQTLANGNFTFSNTGVMNPTNAGPPPTYGPVAININNLADGAAALKINWNLTDSTGTPTLTQYAETSSTSATSQDGFQASELTGVALQNGGQVVASFSNGQQKTVAQLAMASIENPNSLQNVGNNNFAATTATAAPAIGVAQTGGRGQILGNAIEASNVDMATQFTNLIVYQSGYQASSRVISTEDQMSQDLLNLIH